MPSARGAIRCTQFLFSLYKHTLVVEQAALAPRAIHLHRTAGTTTQPPIAPKKNCSRNNAIMPIMIVINVFLLNHATSTARIPASKR